MLHVSGLRKRYGDVVALRGVDLAVERGEIVSLLGPNGAGKTTLVSIVTGLKRADEGSVRVADVDALAEPHRARQLIGLAPQDLGIYPVVSVRNNLVLFGELAGLRGSALAAAIDEVAVALDITDLLARKAGDLSGGQKRRLHTAIALLHRPQLLLLDEATVGADVETRAQLLALVRRMAHDHGSAVLYSTHYLHEVEELGASVAILDHGQVIARGGVDELIQSHARPVVEFSFDRPPGRGVPEEIDRDGALVRVAAEDPATTIAAVLRETRDEVDVTSVSIVRPSLEAVYLALTGRHFDPVGAARSVEESV